MDNAPDPANPPPGLVDYWAANGRLKDGVWRVSFQEEEAFTQAPEPGEFEAAMKKVDESIRRSLDDLTAAAFSGKLNSEPAPETCQGNQHVFKLGAQYCLCGKVKDE